MAASTQNGYLAASNGPHMAAYITKLSASPSWCRRSRPGGCVCTFPWALRRSSVAFAAHFSLRSALFRLVAGVHALVVVAARVPGRGSAGRWHLRRRLWRLPGEGYPRRPCPPAQGASAPLPSFCIIEVTPPATSRSKSVCKNVCKCAHAPGHAASHHGTAAAPLARTCRKADSHRSQAACLPFRRQNFWRNRLIPCRVMFVCRLSAALCWV